MVFLALSSNATTVEQREWWCDIYNNKDIEVFFSGTQLCIFLDILDKALSISTISAQCAAQRRDDRRWSNFGCKYETASSSGTGLATGVDEMAIMADRDHRRFC